MASLYVDEIMLLMCWCSGVMIFDLTTSDCICSEISFQQFRWWL